MKSDSEYGGFTEEHFWDYIHDPSFVRQAYIVSILMKYSEEEDWEHTNELLLPCENGDFEWCNDWHEGQKYVEIVGCIAVSDVNVPINLFLYEEIKRDCCLWDTKNNTCSAGISVCPDNDLCMLFNDLCMLFD